MKIGNISIKCRVSPAVFRQMHGIFDELCKLRPHPDLENVSERNFGIYQD